MCRVTYTTYHICGHQRSRARQCRQKRRTGTLSFWVHTVSVRPNLIHLFFFLPLLLYWPRFFAVPMSMDTVWSASARSRPLRGMTRDIRREGTARCFVVLRLYNLVRRHWLERAQFEEVEKSVSSYWNKDLRYLHWKGDDITSLLRQRWYSFEHYPFVPCTTVGWSTCTTFSFLMTRPKPTM